MGRAKLNMELIRNERSRMITYHKRKKGLLKKAREFQILCGVDTCVIVFGPKQSSSVGRPIDVESWPTEQSEVRRIINRYRSGGSECKKTQDLSHFFESRKKKVDDEIAKSRRAYLEAKFPVWDNRLNFLTLDQLRVLAGVLEAKLDVAKARLLKMKGSQLLMDDSRSGINIGGSIISKSSLMPCSTFANNPFLQRNSTELQQLALNHLHQPSSDQFLQQMLPFNASPIYNPMLKMMVNSTTEDFSQFDGISSGTIPCINPIKSQVSYNYDPVNEILGNMMFNNPVAHQVSYYGQSRLQPILPYQQSPMNQNVPSQMHAPQFSDFADVGWVEMGRKDRFWPN